MNTFLKLFAFNSPYDLMLSLLPSIKYKTLLLVCSFSVFAAFVQSCFGFEVPMLIAILVALSIELVSGLAASQKRGEKIESLKFSRFALKIGIWLGVFYIVHQFTEHFINKNSITLEFIFSWASNGFLMVFFCEYAISILENLACLQGKERAHYIQLLINKIKLKGEKSIASFFIVLIILYLGTMVNRRAVEFIQKTSIIITINTSYNGFDNTKGS